jgi:hypothetical protein
VTHPVAQQEAKRRGRNGSKNASFEIWKGEVHAPNDCTRVSNAVANADTGGVGRSVSEARLHSETVQAGPQRRQEPKRSG